MSSDSDKPDSCAPDACGSCNVSSCSSRQTPGATAQPPPQEDKLTARLKRIKRKIIVMSGKGGVGKSTVATNLAMTAMLSGRRVGILDADLHGPSVPTMLGLIGERFEGGDEGIRPVEVGGLKVVSLGFLLEGRDTPAIWRGPMKMGVIKQFLEDVDWGDLDLLVIDVPPGTGDEPLSICQLIPDLDGAVIVTTPQKVATADVRRSIGFCREMDVKVLGVVENMSGFACPKCGEVTPILRTGGGKVMAEEMGVPFLGAIPMDPMVAQYGDDGKALVEHAESSPAAGAFREITQALLI